MKKHKSPFGGNVFIVNHKRKHRFVSTAKVGCTTLKYITVIDDKLYDFDPDDKPQKSHDILGYKADGKKLVPTDSKKYNNYTTVAIWRDPLKRFASWYSDKVYYPYQPYIFLSGLAVEGTVDRCLEFLKFELSKSDPEWMDEHVRPQSAYFDPSDIDVFVDISNLSDYLESIGVQQEKRLSNTSSKQEVNLTDEQVTEFKELYKADYELYELIKDKLWSLEEEPTNED